MAVIRYPDPLPLPGTPQPGDGPAVRRLVGMSRTKVVVLDDDPTGTQTVHGVDVLARWSVDALSEALADANRFFYVLSDTRGLPENEAAAVVREISQNLSKAAQIVGTPFAVVSRSDSTLRGHFAAELKAIEGELGQSFDATLVVPAFIEAGRFTIDAVHYVAREGVLVPVAETEFARDRTFSYRQSRLPEWIEEKTHGATRSRDVEVVRLETLRQPNGNDAVFRQLSAVKKGRFVVVDAAAYSDLETFVHGLLRAEAGGRRYLYRTAASFVRVRAAIEPKPLLSPSDICQTVAVGGLVIVGSYVEATTNQVNDLLNRPGVSGMEVDLDRLVTERPDVIASVAAAATHAIHSGSHAVLYTSRRRLSASGPAGDLASGARISSALAEIIRSIGQRPRFVIAKGGKTSGDLAILGLGMRRARVLGQAVPGVPVWQLGDETRWPGIRYVLWPGNVGSASALGDFVSTL